MDPMQNPDERYEPQYGGQGGARERAEEGLEKAWRKTQEGIRSMKDQAGEGLDSVRQRLSEGARATIVEQKDKSVGSLRRLSLAIHEAAAKLDDEGDHTLAEYTELLGARVEKAADYLKQKEPSAVLRDFENLARRQTGLFIGGLFVTGLVIARLIKSSRRDDSPSTTELAPEDLTPEPATGPSAPTVSTPAHSQPTIPTSSRFGQGI